LKSDDSISIGAISAIPIGTVTAVVITVVGAGAVIVIDLTIRLLEKQ
jgi:hypothetical protein